MSGHTGSEHDNQHHQQHDHTPGDSTTDSASEAPKHRFGGTSTVTDKTMAFLTAKLPNRTSRIVAAAAAGALVLGGAGTAYAVHQGDVSHHNKQVAEAAAVKLAADRKASADKEAADAAALDAAAQASADASASASADKAAADKAAADKAAADKAASDKAASDKAASDKAAADRAAAAAAANRDAQRQPLPSATSTTTGAPKATATPKPSSPTTTTKPPTATKPPTSYGSAYDIAKSMVPASQFGCFANVVERESGWNVHATNPGSGAYGLGQALPGDKMASAGSDWRDNPATQIKWVLSYMDSRYGSPCGAWSFWQSHSWY